MSISPLSTTYELSSPRIQYYVMGTAGGGELNAFEPARGMLRLLMYDLMAKKPVLPSEGALLLGT